MKNSNKLLYKTIKAVRFYASLFDIDSGKPYKLVTAHCLSNYGYYLIKQVDNGQWLVIKEAPIRKNEVYGSLHSLPYLTRIRLYQFLSQNYGFSKQVQKVIDSLDL